MFAKKYPKNNREKRIRFQKRDTSATTRVHQALRVTTEKSGLQCYVVQVSLQRRRLYLFIMFGFVLYCVPYLMN